MKNKYLILLTWLVVLNGAAFAEGKFFDGGWRVSVGAAYNSPAKVGLHFSPVKFNGGNIVPYIPTTRTSAEAKKIAEGTTTGTRTEYGEYNGQKIFVDTVDYGTKYRKKQGIEDGTWNVRVPYDSWNGSAFVLAEADYATVQQTHDGHGQLRLNGSDEAAMPGVTVDVSRNLYHNEEKHFGVDLAFLVSYFFQTDLFRDERSAYRSDTTTVNYGKWQSSISPVSGVREESRRRDDGTYGAGSYYGPGPVFNTPVALNDIHISSASYYNSAALMASGDYRDLEMILGLRPYYDFYDWLRVYGTVGVAVSWSKFNLDIAYAENGSYWQTKRSYSQWDVYGVGGLGLMLRWRDFCLGVDILTRFLDDDLEIDDELVRGHLRRSRLMLRGVIGYEF